MLLEAGVDIDARENRGLTPLHYAAGNNTNPDVAALLLEAGADPGVRDIRGNTPLAYAERNAAVKGTEVHRLLNESSVTAACQIEDWRWQYVEFYKVVSIEGTATCETGKITIRAYDGNGEFVGTGWGFIEGHVFTITPIMDILRKPRSLNIKSTIDDGNTLFDNLNKLLNDGRFK